MDVEIYASGEEFLNAAEIRQFDCVLLDLHRPTRNGHEVLSRLSQLATRIPVVAIASDDKPEARARVLSAGAAAYLLTPVDKHALLNAIATATLVQQSA
jgi:CheY-like chemotaxis protein